MLGKDEIIEGVWGGRAVGDDTLAAAVSRLRSALGETPQRRYIETLPKRGYRLVFAETQVASGAAAASEVPAKAAALASQGRAALASPFAASQAQARLYFEAAVREAPGWAPAHVGLAETLAAQHVAGQGAGMGLMAAAKAAAHAAVGLDPGLARAWSVLVMGALAAPLSEEAAFRGYAMGILQKAWGHAPAAIVGSSILFAAVHFVQGLDAVKLSLYFAAGILFATIGYLTNSLYAVMVVHSLGDVLGFTVLWPHDQAHHAMGLQDPMFAPALVALAVFTPLAIMAVRRLEAISRNLRAPSGLVRAQALGARPIAA